jgi:cytosine/adenosine deaminase-related metal-dependent hydrolase
MPDLLIRNADVLDTEPEPVLHKQADVLVRDGLIAAVGPDLDAAGAEVFEATDRIVLPGFVDTHRHLWQTALRGLVVDDDLRTYLDLVLGTVAPRYRPEDVYAGNLAGALECLDGGITTVQDFSHLQYSLEHSDAAITALRESGIRAVFGHGYPLSDPSARRPNDVRTVHTRHFERSDTTQHSADRDDDLVTMALAPVGPAFMPLDLVEEDWRLADELGIPIVVHIGSGPGAEHPIDALRQRGLLRASTLYVHGNSLPDEDLALIKESGAAVSITPAVEAQMLHGAPMVNRLHDAGITTGLGVDVVTSVAGDMFELMRATLLTSRLSPGTRRPAADMLRLATLDGARALGLDDRIGSLRPGKQADLVLLRANDLNLLGAANLIGAVVTAAHPGNVEAVLVAGRFVKRDGHLLHANDITERLRASAGHVLSR